MSRELDAVSADTSSAAAGSTDVVIGAAAALLPTIVDLKPVSSPAVAASAAGFVDTKLIALPSSNYLARKKIGLIGA